ncbi:MAG: hypothetical protein HY318_07320 [Armatimonadetes bacterium]|nr:hypothetical protein [Armatimonadota bacterium]
MNILETLQRIAATTQRLDMALVEIERERAARQRFEDAIVNQTGRLEVRVSEMRERLARLEASREADRSQMSAELARFQAEVERAEMRLTRFLPAQSEPRVLPDCEEEGSKHE